MNVNEWRSAAQLLKEGCSLLRFAAASPDPEELSKQVDLLGIDLRIVKGDKLQLRATIAGPKAQFTVTS